MVTGMVIIGMKNHRFAVVGTTTLRNVHPDVKSPYRRQRNE